MNDINLNHDLNSLHGMETINPLLTELSSLLLPATAPSYSCTSSSSSFLIKLKALIGEVEFNGYNRTTLDLALQDIADDDIPDLCCWILKFGRKIKKLDLTGNLISSTGAIELFSSLKQNESIASVHLNSNLCDDRCIHALGIMLESNKVIDTISFKNNELSQQCKISDRGIEMLIPYLDGNSTLKSLDLSANINVTNASIPNLLQLIERSCLTTVNIWKTSITIRNALFVQLVANRLKNGESSIVFTNSDVTDEDVSRMCNVIIQFGIDTLVEVNLEGNKIGSIGASTLFECFKKCSKIESINLSNNQIDDSCMQALGELLEIQSSIEVIDISCGNYFGRGNKITNKGIKSLSHSLLGNTTLKSLNVSYNKGITNTSVPYFVELLTKSEIKDVDIWATSISEDGACQINNALDLPIEQREVPLRSKTKSAAKASYAKW